MTSDKTSKRTESTQEQAAPDGRTTQPPGDFVCEPIKPDRGTFDAASLARGVPGLPSGFTWRGTHFAVQELLESWKQSERESHRGGERYYRKHYYRVRTNRGEVLTVYALRHMKPGENPRNRWWLYTLKRAGEGKNHNAG
jgi:phosphoribosylglycinamide formyltransferase-1